MSNSKIIGGTGIIGGGSGTITATPPVTDNAIVRWDGTTATVIQNSKSIGQDGGGIEAQGFITRKLITDQITIGQDQCMITSGFSIELTGELVIEGDAELVVV